MIERQGGKLIFECDSCAETVEFDAEDNFNESWAEAKRSGWTTRKIANEWLHGCPSCGVPS